MLAIWLAAGCMDGSPAESDPPVPPPEHVLTTLTCAVQVRAATLSCQPPRATPEGISPALLGGQHQNVRLFAWRVSYDGSGVFSADVTVENLIAQVIGTKDNRTPAPEGVRVFFHSGPTVTAGSGAVSVANADGLATFTASDQPYFQYSEMLATEAVSLRREWRFSVPNTVEAFEFVVFVAAPVRHENGWIEITPPGSSGTVNGRRYLKAIVHGVTGLPVPNPPIRWSSSNPAVATVDSRGSVFTLTEGAAIITATGGGLSGSAIMRVYSPPEFQLNDDHYDDGVPPSYAIKTTPSFVRANGSDPIYLSIYASDPWRVTYAEVVYRNPSGTRTTGCSLFGPPYLTSSAHCEVTFPEDAERGLWQIESVYVADAHGNSRTFTRAEIEATGITTVFQVRDPNTMHPPYCSSNGAEPACYSIPYWLPGWHSKLPAATPPALSAPLHP